MPGLSSRPRLLIGIYTFLVLVGFPYSLQSLFFPRWPLVDSISQGSYAQALRHSGYSIKLLPTLSSIRNSELSLSHILSFNVDGHYQLSIVQAAVRQRNNFQTAFISRHHKSLDLSNRYHNLFLNRTDSGLNLGLFAYQTCLVPRLHDIPAAGNTASSLNSIKDSVPRNYRQTLSSIVGLSSPRSQVCLLVTLRSPSSARIDPRVWTNILRSVQLAYQKNLSS